MGKLYKFLGLSVGLVVAGMEPKEKQEAYNADVTYGTNNEFGFDYLRDNMVIYKNQLVQRGLHYAIIDEIDSILIDEARTPLIISVLKSVAYQSTVESLPRKDLYSELTTGEYLYGKGKRIIDKYPTSTICMFRITNLEEINKTTNRETGNNVITSVSRYVRESISSEYLFVRYMGPKFVIAFSGVDVDALKIVSENINRYKDNNKNSSYLIITHYTHLLKYVKPDFVHVVKDGKIIKTGDYELAQKIENNGFNFEKVVIEASTKGEESE